MTGPTAFRSAGGGNDKPAAEKFTFKPLIAVFLVITLAGAFLSNLRSGGTGEYGVSYAIGAMVGVMLLVGVVAGITFLVSKRSSTATNAAIAIVCLLWMAGAGGSRLSGRSQKNEAVLNQIQAQSEAIQAEQREAYAKTGSASVDAERAKQVIDKMADTAKQGTGDDARALQISLDVVKGLATLSASYEAKVNEAQQLGGLDGKGIEMPADLDKRIRVWSDASRLAKQLYAKTAGLGKEVEDGLVAAGISSKVRQGFMAGFAGDGKLAVTVELRRHEETMVNGILEQLTLLKRAYGDWEYDTVKDTIVFQKPEDEESYLAAADRVNQAAAAQGKAQERLMNMQSRGKK
jgi:hypothetical protein